MNTPERLAQLALDGFTAERSKLVERENVAAFELDFELRFVLFLSALIDGEVNASERAFQRSVARTLDWSEVYRGLLDSRIQQLPHYDLSQLRTLPTSPELAAKAFRSACALALCDGDLTNDERLFFQNLAAVLLPSDPGAAQGHLEWALDCTRRTPPSTSLFGATKSAPKRPTPPPPSGPPSPADVEASLRELRELIGLQGVKDEIEKIVRFLEIQEMRKAHELSASSLSLHMVFTGNPGTGKTTVARILAEIFRQLHILRRGHLVETDRSGLIGQYVGHTANKTNEVIDKALDGILFIDEAYSLVGGGENDFGAEAIDTLVKRMEDDRDRLIVIVAGYNREMEDFISANPGLRSRFATFIDFPDYTGAELIRIFDIFCERNQYALSKAARKHVLDHFEGIAADRGTHFGNGRYVRNLFEKALRCQAMRLSASKASPSREQLMTLEPQDFPAEA